MSVKESGRLSVKEVADLLGVTPRTVRHYHAIGVLPEPPRDASGYRRYGGKEVVELARIVRLRGLGMPLAQIAERITSDGSSELSLRDALNGLADELDTEIAQLVASRDRLRELARSETFDQPAKALAQALQDQGVLGPADDLRPGESWAAAVLDALHPQGIPGVIAEASRLFGDASAVASLAPLRRRLSKLGARSSDADIEALAADVAAMLPSGEANLQFDIGLVEVLLADRLNPIQQRFMHQLRAHLQEAR